MKNISNVANAIKIKDIPQESKSDNLWIVLLKDLGDYALYLNKTNNCFAGFEVHKIRFMKARTCNIQGKMFSMPDRRVISNSEGFGKYAWHYPNLDIVFAKYPQFKKHEGEILKELASLRPI